MGELVPGVYRHWKGKDYFVIGVARRPYLAERLVIYRALYGGHVDFARPYEMFTDQVARGSYRGPRFALMDAEPNILQAFGGLRHDEAFLPVLHSETRQRLFVHRGLFGPQDLIIREQEDLRYALEGSRP